MTLKDILESGLTEIWMRAIDIFKNNFSNIYLKKLSFKPKHTNYFINLVNFSFENNLFLFVCSLLNPILWQKSYKDMISECS